LRPAKPRREDGKIAIRLYLCTFARCGAERWAAVGRCARGFLRMPAQLLGQRPVNELHWIENTALINRIVCLTLFPVAVQHTRSLTVSKVSRLVVSPGLKRAHIGHRRTWKSSAKPATAVAGEQGRRSLDGRAQALASPPWHGSAGEESSLAPAKATGPGEQNSSGARRS
jgi:hypothetical protein